MAEPKTAELEAMAARLEASPAYRVLRALQRPTRLDALPDGARVGLYLDLETTGLDREQDVLMELGLVRFGYLADEILGVLDEVEAFEDPGRPIPPEVTRLTGIEDAMVAGQRIDDERVREVADQAALVVAHNASFDRPFAERRFPWLAELPWACTMRDVAWREEGFEGGGLKALVMANGRFFEGHRAVEDCHAGLFLLSQRLPGSGAPVMRALRHSALRREVRIWAVNSPFETKDALRERGYRWSPGARSWWCDVAEQRLAEEEAWLAENVYGGDPPRLPRLEVDAYSRYSRRVPDTPP